MLHKILNFFINIKQKQAIFIILLIACFLSINTFIILEHNKFYSYLDESVSSILDMSHSFLTEYELINYIYDKKIYEAIKLLYNYWKPPAFFVLSAPLLLLIKNINLFLSIFNFLLIFLTLFSIFQIVKKLYSIQAGLFASFILSCCPLFFVIHRTFFIETLLTTSIAIVLYIIINNKFDNVYWNICLIIFLTISFLTKEQIFIFCPIFLLFILIDRKNYINIKRILTILLVFFVSYMFAYILWYQHNAPNIFSHLLKYAVDDINKDYFYYIKSLYFFCISPIIFILFVISSIYFIIKKQHLTIIFSFLFILFIFSLSTNKVSRHIVPVILFLPILISLFIFQIKNIYTKRIFLLIVCLFIFFQYIFINYTKIKLFSQNNFYKYNFFKGVTYYNYKSKIQTYKQQYEYLKDILGENFKTNTMFINFFPPHAYNFLILQKDRKEKVCDICLYEDIKKTIGKHVKYKNIIVSSINENEFNKTKNWLSTNNYIYSGIIDIFNHTPKATFLYTKKDKSY